MSINLSPPIQDVNALVALALAEDLTPLGDITSSLLDPALRVQANIAARQSGVIAGSLCVQQTFQKIDSTLKLSWQVADGESVEAGGTIASVEGPYVSLLTAERTALNFLSRLSGIATKVSKWVKLANGRVVVWDTRKTIPGFRSLEKAAVRAGGGSNHRSNLSDWIMLKDNHLVGIDIAAAIRQARSEWPMRTVQVEADEQSQALAATKAGADLILLDNFTPRDLSQIVNLLKEFAAENKLEMPKLEASGGITFDTLDQYASTGVDYVSSGSLTNSVDALDIGLDVLKVS